MTDLMNTLERRFFGERDFHQNRADSNIFAAYRVQLAVRQTCLQL